MKERDETTKRYPDRKQIIFSLPSHHPPLLRGTTSLPLFFTPSRIPETSRAAVSIRFNCNIEPLLRWPGGVCVCGSQTGEKSPSFVDIPFQPPSAAMWTFSQSSAPSFVGTALLAISTALFLGPSPSRADGGDFGSVLAQQKNLTTYQSLFKVKRLLLCSCLLMGSNCVKAHR